MLLKSTLLASVAATALAANATAPAITVEGNAFIQNGNRFYVRGVDYQPGGSSNLTDPLSDVSICGRDIPYFKQLGINTVRVYTVDNSLNHDACMQQLSAAGIYLILDVNTPDASISRSSPQCSYNADYLQSVFATIDAFAHYDNVLGFFAGNEVINDNSTTNTATYVKATVRDMKTYLKARNYRQIPVGYSAADITTNRLLAAEYFNCGDDETARIDFFGVNDYSWCGHSSFQLSGYSQKVQLYQNYSQPIILSEFGCNTVPGPRGFSEIASIYSTQMTGVFSGGLVYEYSEEDNHYGLVQVNGDSVSPLQDYDNLKAQYQAVQNPSGNGGANLSNGQASECPPFQAGIWEANNTLPEMPSAASAYLTAGAGAPFGTGVITQNFGCDAQDDTNDSSSSSGASATTTQSSAAPSSSTSANTTSSHSSKSKAAAAGVEVPFVFSVIAEALAYVM